LYVLLKFPGPDTSTLKRIEDVKGHVLSGGYDLGKDFFLS
jgi:hypothetical protein